VQSLRQRQRSFGLSVGGVLLLLAVLFVWRGRLLAAEVAGAVGVVLVFFGYVAPAVLKWPSAAWWRFATILGYVNARIILTVAFVLVLTPMGLIWRLIGRDPLARARARWPGWVPHPARYQRTDHYTRMY
jgi:hypothetical protein